MNTEKKLIPLLRFPEYKESIGWKESLIKNVCSIGTGKSNSQDQVEDGKYPFFIRSEVPVRSNRYLYDCEAVITIGDGKIGKVFHYINGKFDLHQRCYKMTDFKDVDGKFFYYYFSSHFYERAMKMTAKATVDSVRLGMISEMPISFPSISEQQKIAECLSSIDSYISSINEKVEQLKAHKTSLLQKLFPQKGQTVPEYRLPEFKTNEDWTTNRVGESFKLQGGFAFKSNKFIATGIPVIRISNIPSDSLVVNLQNCVFYEELPNMHNYTANDGDLLIAMSGATTGKTAIYRGKKPVYVNQRVGIFKLVDNSIYYPFICQWIRTDHFANQIKKMLAAGAQPNISSNDIESLLWQHPQNMKEQMKIASCLSTIDDLIDAYKNKLIYIEDYKKGLIQQLFPINS